MANVDHTRTQVKSPQTNGIGERLHTTVLNEVYRRGFRKKLDGSLEELQADVELRHREYNEENPPGPVVLWEAPLQTFAETSPLAKEKLLAA